MKIWTKIVAVNGGGSSGGRGVTSYGDLDAAEDSYLLRFECAR